MQLTEQQHAARSTRLAAVRRLYIYTVSFVSLTVGLFSFAGLMDVLANIWLQGPGEGMVGSSGYARTVASSAGLLLVMTPLFLVHWGLAQRHRGEADERDSVLRKLYLYGVTSVSLGFLLVNSYRLINGLAELAFGISPEQANLLPAAWLTWTVVAIANGLLVAYWYGILQSDGDYGTEARGGQLVRRLFLIISSFTGLAVTIWGTSQVIRVLLSLSVGRLWSSIGVDWWQNELAVALAQALVGGWLLFQARSQWNAVIVAHPNEGQSVIRRIYLYVAVVVGAITSLTPAALVLNQLLLMVFGSGMGDLGDLIGDLIDSLAFVPVGLVVWLRYWTVLEREADVYGETEQAATVRRLYYYLVAATGLALTWAGVVALLHALLDALLTGNSGVPAVWSDPLANGLSLVAVGAPIWAFHWRAVQRVARQDNAEGASERNSLPRRIYLYGVALVGILIFLFPIAQIVYRLLLMAMGDPQAELFSAETAYDIAESLVAAVVWAVHLLAIRGDARFADEAPTADTSPPDVTTRRRALEQQIAALEEELVQARRSLAALDAEDTPVDADH